MHRPAFCVLFGHQFAHCVGVSNGIFQGETLNQQGLVVQQFTVNRQFFLVAVTHQLDVYKRQGEMLGRLLFDAADLGRQLHCDAEEALEQTNRAFTEYAAQVEKTASESV